MTPNGVEYHGQFKDDEEIGEFLVKTPVGQNSFEVAVVHFDADGSAQLEHVEHSIHPMVISYACL